MYELKRFTPIAKTNFRNHSSVFGILPPDRLHSIFCIGKSGTGKSRLMINMALDDIYKGNAVVFLDPHADAVTELFKKIPEHRKKDVIYFDATNTNALPAFNPLHNVPEAQHQLVASEVVATFKKMFLDAWGSKLEHYLRNAVVSLLCYPDASLLDISPLLLDKEFRAKVLKYVTNPYILSFWRTDYNLLSPSQQVSVILPILNKIGVLLANDTLRGIFGQQKEGISFEHCMNNNKIVLCNLSKGEIGEDVMTVLGSFITTAMQHAAMRRATIPIEKRKPCYLFIDETQNFVSSSFATMIPQVRKFGLGLFLCNQHIGQLDPETRNAILANFGTLISFRIGLDDAKVMEKQFYPVFNYDDFISLPPYHIYIKLLIEGRESKGFSAVTLSSFN